MRLSMSFLDNIVSRKGAPPHEAVLTAAVALLTLSGDFTELERRIISLFRDQFPALSRLQEQAFAETVEKAIDLVHKQGAAQDIPRFVQEYLLPSITIPD